jgi:hypothetical protein
MIGRADKLERLARLELLAAELRADRGATIKARNDAMQNLLILLAMLGTTAGAVYAGHAAELRQREALALQCARNSDGTDMAIAQCYIDRDLDLPEGI